LAVSLGEAKGTKGPTVETQTHTMQLAYVPGWYAHRELTSVQIAILDLFVLLLARLPLVIHPSHRSLNPGATYFMLIRYDLVQIHEPQLLCTMSTVKDVLEDST
jgi:hypothetical protein